MNKNIILPLTLSLLSALSVPVFADEPQFYVRADAGLSVNKAKTQNITTNNGNAVKFKHKSSPVVGLGFGYQIAPNMRTDLTYSLITSHKAHKNYSHPYQGGSLGTYQENTSYNGKIDSQVLMLNAYYDLVSYESFTPYVTAGAGVAFNKAKKFNVSRAYVPLTPVTLISSGSDSYKSKMTRNFAWKVGAGSSFNVTNDVKFDLGYSYTDLGKAQTSTSGTTSRYYNGTNGLVSVTVPANPSLHPKFKRLHSHQITGGLRYSF